MPSVLSWIRKGHRFQEVPLNIIFYLSPGIGSLCKDVMITSTRAKYTTETAMQLYMIMMILITNIMTNINMHVNEPLANVNTSRIYFVCIGIYPMVYRRICFDFIPTFYSYYNDDEKKRLNRNRNFMNWSKDCNSINTGNITQLCNLFYYYDVFLWQCQLATATYVFAWELGTSNLKLKTDFFFLFSCLFFFCDDRIDFCISIF